MKPRAAAFGYKQGTRELSYSDGKGKDSPPSGKYDIKSLIGTEGPKSSLGSRIPIKISDSPGPGQYSTLDSSSISKNAGNNRGTFGNRSEARMPIANTISGGPGAYDVNTSLILRGTGGASLSKVPRLVDINYEKSK